MVGVARQLSMVEFATVEVAMSKLQWLNYDLVQVVMMNLQWLRSLRIAMVGFKSATNSCRSTIWGMGSGVFEHLT